MRLTALLLTVAFLQVQASTSGQTVTLTGKDLTLKEIFTAIKAQTGYMVFGKQELLDSGKLVTIAARNMVLTEFLDEVMKGQPLIYKISGKSIALSVKPFEPVGFFPSARDVPITIKGKITDSTGNPIQGASIRLRPGNKGAFSGVDGAFVMADVAPGSYTLEISYVGFETVKRKITVAEDGSFDVGEIVLQVSNSYLNEVVVNKGYYSEKQRLSTGSVSRITSKEIERQPLSSPLLALQGRVAGLQITPQNGAPAAAPKIRIRGQNSIRFDAGFPLYIVDGVIIDSRALQSQSSGYFGGMDPLTNINPENIESIEVLKDADATSIYGSRGANGVILITTRQAKASNKVNLDVNTYFGASRVAQRMKLLNRRQYLDMRNEAFANDGATPSEYDYDLTKWDTTRETDWQDELLGGTANTSDIQAAISGGNNNTTFRLTGNYYKETSIISKDFGYTRGTAGINLNHRSSDDKLSINFTANYGTTKNKILSLAAFMSNALELPPIAPALYNNDGSINWDIINVGGSVFPAFPLNPMSQLIRTNESTIGTLMANGVIRYTLFSGFSLKMNLGYNDANGDEIIIDPIAARAPIPGNQPTGYSTFGTNKRKSWLIEPQVEFSKQFGRHEVNTLLGGTLQSSTSIYQAINASGYTSDAFLGSLNGATSYYYLADDEAKYRYVALFLRAGYNFADKYILNITGRRDGSSRFGPGRQYGNFGSLGAAWVFSEERFVKDHFKFLSFGKLRSSYGVAGNDQIGDYRFYNLFTIYTKYLGQTTLVPNSLYNPNLNWEATKKFEGSLEIGLLKNKLDIQATWYKNRSSNQLIFYKLPYSTGFDAVFRNFGATVENRGWEFSVQSKNITGRKFSWTTSLNLTIPQNELVEFPGIELSSYATTYKVGEPLSVLNLFTWGGIDPKTGLHVIVDVDKNGVIDDADRRFQNTSPNEYFGGILNSISFHSFEFSFLLQFAKRFGDGPHFSSYPGMFAVNQPVEVLNRWRKEGDRVNVAKLATTSGDYYNELDKYTYIVAQSDYNIVNTSFIKLKTVSLAYNLNNEWLNRLKVKKSAIFLQGQNLLGIDKNFNGLDPETGARSLPQMQMFTGGIQIVF